MEKVYGFLWHAVPAKIRMGEGLTGSYCQAFETESRDELAARTIMHVSLHRHMIACEDPGCEHTPIITNELSPKMILSGMTANMRGVETPTNKRELVLRVMSCLRQLPPDKLGETLRTLPLEVGTFLNDSTCLAEPSPEEIEDFCLGKSFLIQDYP